MKVFKVTRPDHGKANCIHREWDSVESEFDGAELGEQIIVELVEMSAKQLDALPDFAGW